MIYIYIDHKERLDFYSRFTISLDLLGKGYTLITHKLSLYILARSKKLKVELITKKKKQWDWECKFSPLEVENKYLDYNSALNLYSSYCEHLINRVNDEDVFFIWNGNDTPCLALKKVASLINAKTLFFEQPNITDKCIVDRLGTNADSSLATENEIIKYSSDASDKDFEKIANEIINKKRNRTIPQRKINTSINYHHIIDVISNGLGITPKSDNRHLFNKLKDKIRKKRFEVIYDDVDLQSDYIFVPLQIESDTQLIRHSNYSNLDIVEHARKLAGENNSELYVKLHPAEVDDSAIKAIIEFCGLHNIRITNADTYELIDSAKFVVLNNSTVGLEALLMNKEVITLGNPFYKDFKLPELKNYLFEYLIQDLDYFGEEEVDIKTVSDILERLTNE